MVRLISNSTDETKEIGRRIAPFLKKGDVLVLTGDLGTGKTMFVAGILGYFGKEQEVSSPTFTIINEYDLNDTLKMFHFDVYRFQSEDEFAAIGGEEFFEKGICLIEWGEQIAHYLPNEYIKLSLQKDTEDENKRIITLTAIGHKYEAMLSEVFENENISN